MENTCIYNQRPPSTISRRNTKRLLKMYSYKNEVVLDPFLGSGTTAKVALDLGRNCIGIEVNPKYLTLIEKSIGLTQRRLLAPISYKVIRYDWKEKVQLPFNK